MTAWLRRRRLPRLLWWYMSGTFWFCFSVPRSRAPPQLPHKPFYAVFKLAGFTSFDGQFQA